MAQVNWTTEYEHFVASSGYCGVTFEVPDGGPNPWFWSVWEMGTPLSVFASGYAATLVAAKAAAEAVIP